MLKAKRLSDRISGLDGIRAISFLMVLGGHSGFAWIPPGFAVTVFFFLSGYLITTLLRKEFLQTGDVSIAHFYIRRAFRILPPVYVAMALGVSLACIGVIHSPVHWGGVFLSVLFLTNYSDMLIGVGVPAGLTLLWSLAVEEHFYLLFPCVYRGVLKAAWTKKRQTIFFGIVCAAVLVWRLVEMGFFHRDWMRVYTGTDTRLDSILFGSIMAISFNPVIDHLPGEQKWYSRAAWLAFLVLLGSITLRDVFLRETTRYSIQGLALFPIFVYIVRYKDSILTRSLDWKPLVHIGDLSYSLYLVHSVVLSCIDSSYPISNTVQRFVVAFVIAYFIALAMRHVVELPSQRMRNRILARSTPLPALKSVPPTPSVPL